MKSGEVGSAVTDVTVSGIMGGFSSLGLYGLGNPISLAKQRVNGQDIPLPDSKAQGPHTVIGGIMETRICMETRISI